MIESVWAVVVRLSLSGLLLVIESVWAVVSDFPNVQATCGGTTYRRPTFKCVVKRLRFRPHVRNTLIVNRNSIYCIFAFICGPTVMCFSSY